MWQIIAVLALMVSANAVFSEAATNIFESPAAQVAESEIDKLVFPELSKLGIKPVICSDSVFVRRVYLDVIGTLPSAKEAKEFLTSTNANKRQLLIERLLERDEFADYWAMRWSDILRIKAEFPVNLWPNAAQAYHRWVHASIAENKPYDKFVRELLTSSGSNFRVGPVNFYRAIQNRTPAGIASAVALAFLGERTDSWPSNRFIGMQAFFAQIGYKPTSEWKEEDVFWDPLGVSATPGNAVPGRVALSNAPTSLSLPERAVSPPLEAMFPDGTKVMLSPNRDPREVFADWLISSQNTAFKRSIVNRLWAWLMGRGIIHEADDIRNDNPPSNPGLLVYLEEELTAGHYDLKRIYRIILNSKTYQMSSMPCDKPGAEGAFARYPLRRLDAEVLIDAINKVTGASDLYTSPIPEPFTYIPEDEPAISIADGSITSPFLALFGRSARATGMENERNTKPVPAQWLHLLNSTHIYRKLDTGAKLKAIIGSGKKQPEIIEELYLTMLSRFPTEQEIATIESYGQTAPARAGRANAARQVATKKREDWIDVAWSLVNSAEFLYRH
jgi:hypothetical protein